MKILFYGDTHLRETSSFPQFNRVQQNFLTGELNNILLSFDFVKDMIIEHEPDLVIHLGDSYHKDNYISLRTLYAADLGFQKISEVCKKLGIDHLIIAGNHDIYASMDTGSKLTSICTLRAHGVPIIENSSYELGDFQILLLPYTDSLEEAYQGIVSGSGYNLIAAHLEFQGAVHDNNHLVEHGLDPNVGIPIVCGHIHLPQIIGDVSMPGSLIQGRFVRDDLENVGGVLLYTTTSNTKKLLRNNRSKHYVRVRDLNMLKNLDPEHCVLKIYSEIPEEDVKEQLEGFEYVYITVRNKDIEEEGDHPYFQDFEKPEQLLRNYISDTRPEFLDLYDEVI